MRTTAPKSPNSSASVLKTSSHKRRRWKRAKHWFWWIPRKRSAKMVSEVPKMIVLWNFATKSRLKASLAVWRNLLPYIFQGGVQPGSPSRRAVPARLFCKNKQVNLKNKPKIGNLPEKQAQNGLAGKFNKTKNQQANFLKIRVTNSKKQAQNEQIFTKTRPICL